MKPKREENRFANQRKPLALLADLMRGSAHDRHTAAAFLGTKSPANAYRLLSLLKDNVPGVVEEAVKKGEAAKVRFAQPAVVEKPPEYPVAVAACFGASLASLFDGTHYESGMKAAVSYVLQRARRAKEFKDIDRKFIFVRQGGEPSLRERSGEFDDLIDALIHHHPVRFSYSRQSGGDFWVTAKPLSIAVYDHQLYMVARNNEGRIKPYRFSRSRQLTVEKASKFVYPPMSEYDPHEFFTRFFGVTVGAQTKPEHVVVKLSGPWARFAKSHRWHRTQETHDDVGSVRVEMDVPICQEVESWVLGFGEHVKVIEPDSLKETIRKRVAAAAAQLRAK